MSLIVGLTGNLASGKTTVAEIFRKLGAKIINADKTAHELIKSNGPCFKRIVQVFGKEILKGGEIDRKKLASIVFQNETKLKKLNKIVHPEVIRVIRRQIEGLQNRSGVVVVEAALLIESGLNRWMDTIILVKANRAVQIKRVLARMDISRREAVNRMKQQMSIKEKMKYADIIIDNRGNLNQTKQQTEEIWQKLSQRKQKK